MVNNSYDYSTWFLLVKLKLLLFRHGLDTVYDNNIISWSVNKIGTIFLLQCSFKISVKVDDLEKPEDNLVKKNLCCNEIIY